MFSVLYELINKAISKILITSRNEIKVGESNFLNILVTIETCTKVPFWYQLGVATGHKNGNHAYNQLKSRSA
ncbi:MAG: hypothetical protein LCH54_16195 [Bacteroidetes bacterium]|nr:hypothetical protein [Bacteroidota bacterium]